MKLRQIVIPDPLFVDEDEKLSTALTALTHKRQGKHRGARVLLQPPGGQKNDRSVHTLVGKPLDRHTLRRFRSRSHRNSR